jgi:hypothetical protein
VRKSQAKRLRLHKRISEGMELRLRTCSSRADGSVIDDLGNLGPGSRVLIRILVADASTLDVITAPGPWKMHTGK